MNIPFHLINAGDYLTPDEDLISGVVARWSPDFTTSSIPQLYAQAVSRAICRLVDSLYTGCLVVDFSPLRAPSAWVESVIQNLPENIPVCQVCELNVVSEFHFVQYEGVMFVLIFRGEWSGAFNTIGQ